MKTKRLLFFTLMILTLQIGCVYAVRYDGPYHGKVVDQETREPIERAVILGTWGVYHYGLAGGYTTFHDARETVTDRNGEFTISGHGLLILSSVGPMDALIYKSGYTYYRSGPWSTIKTGLYSSKDVKWEGNVPIFPLRKLTEEERKKQLLPSEDDVPSVLMRQEINKEALFRGYSPLP